MQLAKMPSGAPSGKLQTEQGLSRHDTSTRKTGAMFLRAHELRQKCSVCFSNGHELQLAFRTQWHKAGDSAQSLSQLTATKIAYALPSAARARGSRA